MFLRISRLGVDAAVVAAAAAMMSPAAGAPPRVAAFAPAPGWVSVRLRPLNANTVVAVTKHDALVVRPFAVFTSLTQLSTNGVVVWISTVGRGRSDFPIRRAWPPRLSGFRVERGWETQPAANIQQRTWEGSVNGWDLDVRVFFATQHPSAGLRAKAQSGLNRLRLP